MASAAPTIARTAAPEEGQPPARALLGASDPARLTRRSNRRGALQLAAHPGCMLVGIINGVFWWWPPHRIRTDPALNCALVLMSGWTGVGFSTYGPDEAVRYSRQDAQTSALETFTIAYSDRV
jgi:hypothetical protein